NRSHLGRPCHRRPRRPARRRLRRSLRPNRHRSDHPRRRPDGRRHPARRRCHRSRHRRPAGSRREAEPVPALPTSIFWRRTDTDGCDHALVDDRDGLRARGTAVAATPVPYTCRYELVTDERWATMRLEVTTEGAGWERSVRLEHAAGRWRVTTAEDRKSTRLN